MQANVLIQTLDLSHEDWLKYRNLGIGGSDAGAICGLNPYKSPLSVYLDKTGQGSEIPDNEAMRQGRDLEEYVGKRFEEATGKKIRRKNAILQHPEHPWMIANVDRLIQGENAGLEIKTTSMLNVSLYKDNNIPEHYELQCHHYMAVTGAEKWYLAVLIFNREFMIRAIPRDESIIKSLVDIEEKFWKEHVEKKVMPAPDGSNDAKDVIKSLYDTAEEGYIINLYGDENRNRVKRYLELDGLMKDLDKEKELLKQELQFEMKDAEKAIVDDHEIKWSNVSSRRFDSTRFKKEKPDLYKDYLNESTSRRFQIR